MFNVLSRRENDGDRCPQCRQINVDFMDVGGGLLGCYQCGSVFVRKTERKRGVVKVEAMMTAPSVPVTAMEVGIPGEEVPTVVKDDGSTYPAFICETCGKALKTKLALAGHRRSHR